MSTLAEDRWRLQEEGRLIENHVKVYLIRVPGGPWVVDPLTFDDNYPLDGSDDGDYTDLGWSNLPPETKADMNKRALPTGKELIDLMWKAYTE